MSWLSQTEAQVLPKAHPQLARPVPSALVDSLRAALRAHPAADTGRANRLNALAYVLRTNAPSEAAALYTQALHLAQNQDYLLGQAQANTGLGYFYRQHNAYTKALTYTERARQQFARLHDTFNHVRSYYGLARIYFEQGDYGRSVTANLRGLAMSEQLLNLKPKAFLNTQLGITNIFLANYTDARHYLNKGLQLARLDRDSIGVGHACTGLGDLYQAQGRWATAQRYYALALVAYRPVYNADGLLFAELNLADMAARQGNYTSALATVRPLLARASQLSAVDQVLQANLLLARIYLATNQPSAARQHAETALLASTRSGARESSRDASAMLARIAAQTKDFTAAYRYQSLFGAYNDSLTSEAVRRRANALQIGFERNQAENQIRLLKQKNRLQAQGEELTYLRYRQRMAFLVGLGLLVLAVALGFIWYYRRQVRREAALRQRLATDLHDDVGSLLHQISLQSELLREDEASPAQTLDRLTHLNEISLLATRQVADVVWSLNASSASLPEVLDRMRTHADEVLSPTGIVVDFTVTNGAAVQRPVGLICQQLYLIFKAALHGIVKQAPEATHVAVRLSLERNLLCLSVQDNAPTPAPTTRASAMGLANIRQRAEAVGGTLYLRAEAVGFGLEVYLPA